MATIAHICLHCQKEFQVRVAEHNRGKGNFCSMSCATTYRNQKGQLNRKNPVMKGDKNPAWKGGISKNNYHYKKLQVQRYPEKIRARRILAYAVKTEKLHRQPCRVCQTTPTFAHHEDYGKPLNVTWLCRRHHHEEHSKGFKEAT